MSRLGSFLKGVRVLDLSLFLPGPLASLLLADMGAEVLKIEPPAGDGMRQLGPRDGDGKPLFYETVNAGKSVRRIDLKSEDGRGELVRLVADADILLEGFRPGVMARLGLDYETLAQVNPRLIYCSMSGFGAEGPLAHVAAHDVNFLALAGVLYRNGTERPDYFDPPVADSSASLFAVISVLGALQARTRDGRGCRVDLALADTVMPLQLFQVAALGAIGANPGPGETYLNGGAAFYRVYETGDARHVVLGAAEHKFWRNFCEAAGRADWAERYADPMPQAALADEVAAYFRTLNLDQCIARFGSAECCFSPVLDLEAAVGSAHHSERGLVRQTSDGALQSLFPALVDGARPASRPPMREAAADVGWRPAARPAAAAGGGRK